MGGRQERCSRRWIWLAGGGGCGLVEEVGRRGRLRRRCAVRREVEREREREGKMDGLWWQQQKRQLEGRE
ncbi:unnamed protein product [Linum tenue]|uniref:Uncharacterized protein n=1 Tax=Linum tenue TaxID=586396 RepID=A0AAV0MNR4_9ROSI|nr:unnamed protein product [Linum tenue]